MKRRTWTRWARICLYIAGLIIFLELSSSLVLNNLISPSCMERFDMIFMNEPSRLGMLPHPYLGWVQPQYLEEQERYLALLGKNRTDKIYIAALGGSTTKTGYPRFTERHLNDKLVGMNSSLTVMVFNFGVDSWRSLQSVQNYVYIVRYLHPDMVIIHHNTNDLDVSIWPFQQSVLLYPQINNWERRLIKNSRVYRLLKFSYLRLYNPIHYGTEVVRSKKIDFPVQARLSSFLNEEGKNPSNFFRYEFIGGSTLSHEMPLEIQLTENYESLIKYTKADDSILVLTTQHLNYSKASKVKETGLSAHGDQGQNDSRDINNLLRDISTKHNVALVDLDSEMEQYDYLLKDGVHWTEEGIKMKGELIGEAIFEILEEQYNLSS